MPSTAEYEPIPSSPVDKEPASGNEVDSEEDDDSASINALHAQLERDPRFNPPTPSPWKRILLVVFVIFIFWLAYKVRRPPSTPKVVYASRYSKEFKYRPAASPIITERLKDGRIRLRGAAPTEF